MQLGTLMKMHYRFSVSGKNSKYVKAEPTHDQKRKMKQEEYEKKGDNSQDNEG